MGMEGEEVQTKGIDNLFNKIIEKTYPVLRNRGSPRYPLNIK
jgi:hypothetical protein